MTTGARVRAEHVRRAFEREAPVLRDVSMTIEPGQLVTIAGPSGSGKTTLLQLVGGLDRPDGGAIWIDDVCVSAMRRPVALRRHTVGFVFQLHHLLPALTAAGNVELPLIAAGVPRPERRERAHAALERVGLGDRAGDLPEHLSGGERQRVALARAFVHRPRLVLADEPTGGLDHEAARHVLDLLRELRERDGTTLLVVSHDPTLGGRADRELQLGGGVLREAARDGTTVPA